MTTKKTIRIPKVFYDDHVERELPAPEIVRELKTHYFIDANSEHLAELLEDAAFYADPFHYAHAEFGSSLAGIVRSARATKKALESYFQVSI